MSTPIDPAALPQPGGGPAGEQARQQAAQQAAGNAGSSGGTVEGIADLAEAGLELGSVVLDAAADVGGEVVGGALEAVGSGAELLGGCGGCSAAVALGVVLATAGAALAAAWK